MALLDEKLNNSCLVIVLSNTMSSTMSDLDYHNKKDARSSWKRHTIKDAEGSDF